MGGYDVRCVEVSAHLSNQHIVSLLLCFSFFVPSRKLFMILVNSEELIMLL